MRLLVIALRRLRTRIVTATRRHIHGGGGLALAGIRLRRPCGHTVTLAVATTATTALLLFSAFTGRDAVHRRYGDSDRGFDRLDSTRVGIATRATPATFSAAPFAATATAAAFTAATATG